MASLVVRLDPRRLKNPDADLRYLLPDLLASSGPVIRVWSAGCASGQEAYSLAILLADALGTEQFRDRVKIYATDVDEEALAQARAAVFTEREMAGLTPEQVEEYFTPEGARWAFRKDLRRSVIFGRNDLVQDAPISHVDLLLCRNTLMYFNADTQGQILGRLHYALNPGGLLFLGKAEMLLSHGQLFFPVDLTRRFWTVGFDRVRVPAAAVLGPVGDAGAQVEQQMHHALVILSAEAVGAMQAAFDVVQA